ncbi:MAG: hypothetical protein JNL82_32200 [Myxococcales bacterium]|nr:hypothetical protein [Myxococcales bacterium]
MSTVLEQLQTTGFKVVVRDTQTGKTRTLRLVGQGPWDLDADTAIDIDGEAGPRPQVTVAPPPDAAITLRIACTREDTSVRIGASGSGAKAWTAHHRTLLGAPWQLDARGAPFTMLAKTPTLLDDLRAAHPDVTIDTDDCQDTEMFFSGRTAADTAARRSAGRAGRRGERPATAAPAAEAPTLAPPVAAEPEAPPAAPAKRSRRKRETPAAGPGELTWSPISENGLDGFAAPWKDGAYKLLHVAGDAYGLFYERDAGGYDAILCGELDEAKAAAEKHMAGMSVTQLAKATCGAKSTKAPCRSPRTTRVHSAEDLRTRYFTPRYEKAFKDAVADGMSLCADQGGLQTHSDLSVPEALELLRERGEGAVYALENLRSEEPRREAQPEPSAAATSAPPGEPTPAPTITAPAPSSESAPAPSSPADKALIDSFAAALRSFEEDD